MAQSFPAPADAVNLDNCASEPIHIPGHIQSHGALLAFGPGGVLRWASAGATTLLGVSLPAIGEALAPTHFDGDAGLRQAIADELETPADVGAAPRQHDVVLSGRPFHMLLHDCGGAVVAEFEGNDGGAADAAAFALKAHRALDRLRRSRTLDDLLDTAAAEVRALTGFDRVMAYRFRHDASGDVVAEAREPSLEPFLHRRYPASDIPAQARRLYVANTLRLIVDVRSVPVPVAGVSPEPLDMTYCVLRSVSPVHIEYLNNLGIGASMSVSIVVAGELWGMLACHHMAPRHVPYPVRMACDVLAQVLAARVQSVQAAEHGRRVAAASTLRSRMVERLLVSDDMVSALLPSAPELCAALEAGAVVVVEHGRLGIHGPVPEPAAQALLAWLDGGQVPLHAGLFQAHSLEALPPAVREALGDWCGVLALRFDEVGPGWVVVLRREQVQTIAWGGRPEKDYANGPLGPRLTPRGSFDEWRETVRGTSVPWSPTDLEIGRQLLDELGRAAGSRQAEMARARNQLLAVLGHDLRNPLQTISATSHLLGRGADTAKMGQRLQSATSRMQRLIGEVLDMSRLQSGLGLGFAFQPVDLAELVGALVDETVGAYAGGVVRRELPATLPAQVDPDRFAQLLLNLFSNARHHGEAGGPVSVALRQEGGDAVLEVRNLAPAIPAEAASQLFTPFKRQSIANPRNKGGLGLGLYIAHEIAVGHGGTLAYAYADPEVVFTARLPLTPPAPP